MTEDIKELAQLQKKINNLILFGLNKDEICNSLMNVTNMSLKDLAHLVDFITSNHGNYNLIQKIMKSDIVADKDTKDIRIVDIINKDFETITKENLFSMFHKKFDLKSRIRYCKYEYLPYESNILIEQKNGSYIYNTYQPPEWYKQKFYSKGIKEVFKLEKIPTIYDDFLNHLVDGDKKSYNYILKWLANAIRSRNYCMLLAIGSEGVGKGMLGEIASILVGKDNSVKTENRILDGNFNSQLKNKRLVFCDEFTVKNKKQEDRLKQLVNDYVEVEEKYVNAKEIRNYANIYISSNNLDSFKVTGEDRRFSIINVTNLKWRDRKDIDPVQRLQELQDPKNVNKLAHYLYHIPIDENEMLYNFKSKRTDEVRESSLSDWEDWLINEYSVDKAGQEVKIADVRSAIEENYGYRSQVGRTKLQKLNQMYPEKFKVTKVRQNKKDIWIIRFPQLKDTNENNQEIRTRRESSIEQ